MQVGSGASGAAPFCQTTTLRDGRPVTLRVPSMQDKDRVVAAFHKLDPQSVYTRFFSFKKELSSADLKRLGSTDYVNFLALLAVLGTPPDEVAIGGASYVLCSDPGTPPSAEVSFTIEEDYQGQGLASKLLATMAGIARAHGIAQFQAEVLAENAAMLSVFERSGLPLKRTRQGGVIHLVMDLHAVAPTTTRT